MSSLTAKKLLYAISVAALPWLGLVFVFVLAGCPASVLSVPDRIVQEPHASGDDQCAMYGCELPLPFRVSVQGPQEPGLLGGEGRRRGIQGAQVLFRVESPDCGSVFVESDAPEVLATTDAAGMASARLRLGRCPGDVEVRASLKDFTDFPPVCFRATAGVERIGFDLEGPTGGVIDAFGVRMENPDGTPAEGVAVHFQLTDRSEGACLGSNLVYTGPDGRAVTSWNLGSQVQRYFSVVEIDDRRPSVPVEQRFRARALRFKAMATNKWEMAIVLLGGLAIFIYGMKLMSEGLQRVADRRLKSILQMMTRNRFLAVGVGALLTAIIQSSSATTVMVVGFVNAGLVTLTQAIGVDLGASIGTTVTAQIIAFRLDSVAYPAIAVGLILAGLPRRPMIRSLGSSLLGFGLLFLGMRTMSGILKPLQYSPEFVALFRAFDCTPISGGLVPAGPALKCILVGTITTAVIQSSSATVGLVLALSSQGLVSFYTAVPLILGDNIGTTITAVLASLAANRNAKRAALSHTLYKIFGASYMYVLLFVPLWHGQPVFLGLVNAITPGDVFANPPENVLRHVANSHTVFNVINCLVLLPFIPALAAVCRKIVPVTDADRETVLEYLEPRLLNSPSLAIEQAVREVAYMVRRAHKCVNESGAFFFGGPRDLQASIEKREDVIDRLQGEITAYLVELSQKNLSPREATLIPALIHAVNDAERIGDHSMNMLELALRMREGKFELSPQADEEMHHFLDLLNQQFEAIYKTFESPDKSQVDVIAKREDEISRFLGEATERHVRRAERGECDVILGIIFLDYLAQLERVGDHLLNIAERAGRIIKVMAS